MGLASLLRRRTTTEGGVTMAPHHLQGNVIVITGASSRAADPFGFVPQGGGVMRKVRARA
jgi:hypothetical protein